MSKIAPHQAMQCKACWPDIDGKMDNWIRASDEMPDICVTYAWYRVIPATSRTERRVISGVEICQGPNMQGYIEAFGATFIPGSAEDIYGDAYWTPVPHPPQCF